MQIKTASVAAVSASVGLSIHKGKTKVLKFKTKNSNSITLDGENWQSKSRIPTLEEHMELKTTFNQYQSGNLQYERQCSSTKTLTKSHLMEKLWKGETFTYRISIIDEHGRSDADVKESIGKTRAAFLQLKNIWKSKQLSTNYKVIIFNTNVKTVLLYGAETWRTTITIIKSAQVFTKHLLHKILNLR
ncbi:unnamed protein product [Schistosoma margrebowiei]|uniref:Uncharacterized protein n=1 Tax=Schistosoma margrebowiei TaxID=48269 RepID=A0A183M1Q6_9TREM|nr:unnamed protein product [Schistosoma margrebowiei]